MIMKLQTAEWHWEDLEQQDSWNCIVLFDMTILHIMGITQVGEYFTLFYLYDVVYIES